MTEEQTPKKKKWRKAVAKAMYQATLEEIMERHGYGGASFNYRWEHVNTVVTLALELAKLTGADAEIVEAAAWLHDVRKKKGATHPQEGAKFARKFLPSTDFPAEKIERVSQAIEEHMGLWRDTPLTNLESMVLWDADKLAKIGLTAVFHWIGGALAGNRPQSTKDLIKFGRQADWQDRTVASMHTAPARQAAVARLKAYRLLWNELEAELDGKDLLMP